MEALKRAMTDNHYRNETPAQRTRRLTETLSHITPDMQRKMTTYSFSLREVLCQSDGFENKVRYAKNKCEKAADDIKEKDMGSKISTLTTSSISVVGSALCFTPLLPIGAGVSAAAGASQIAVSQILEAQIRYVYNNTVKEAKPVCDEISDYSKNVEKALTLRDDAANAWDATPRDCSDTAAKMIVAFKVLIRINEQEAHHEVITQDHCLPAMLLIFYPNAAAAQIVVQLLRGVPPAQVDLAGIGGTIDVSRIGKAILPVIALAYPKALISLGKLIAAQTAFTRLADCGTKMGIKLAEIGMSQTLGKVLMGIGMVFDMITIITTAISFDQPHGAESNLRELAVKLEEVAKAVADNDAKARAALDQIEVCKNGVLQALGMP